MDIETPIAVVTFPALDIGEVFGTSQTLFRVSSVPLHNISCAFLALQMDVVGVLGMRCFWTPEKSVLRLSYRWDSEIWPRLRPKESGTLLEAYHIRAMLQDLLL